MTSTLTPGRLLGEGKYELLSPLGRGAMGSVWLARHVALDRMVAVKLLHPGLQLGRSLHSTQARRDNASERFLKEARTASLLRHKNTVQLLDYGADEVDRWLVMEYLEGRNLSDELYDTGRLPAPRAIAIVTQVLAALAEAHEFGIVHRDLKPANIMLVPWVDDDGHETELAKVLDFGIATMMSDEVADRNEVAGTPEYMSPEQAQAFDVDPRSDLYAVGILLYHLLTGDTPFRGETPMDTMLAQVNGVAVPPRQLERSISRELEAVVLSALAKDPDERPESARAMRAALLGLPEAKGLKADSAQRLPPVASPPTTTSPAASPSPVLVQSQVSGRVATREESPARRGAMLWIALAGLALGAAALVVGLTRSDTVEVATPVPAVILAQAPTPAPTTEAAPAPTPTRDAAPTVDARFIAPTSPTPTAEAVPTPTAEAVPTPTAEAVPTPTAEAVPPPTAEAVPPPTAEAAPTPTAEAVPTPAVEARFIAPTSPPTAATRPTAPRTEPKANKDAKPTTVVAKVEPAPTKVEPPKPEVAKIEPPKPEVAKVEPTPTKVEPVAPPSLSATAGITALSTRGSLPRSVVARALESTRGSLETCYATAARAAGRDQAGGTTATIVYDPDGKVSSVRVAPLPLPGLAECVNQSLWRTRLRERPDTGSVDATFRIVFTPR